MPSLIALSVSQLHARDGFKVAFDWEHLRLSGGDVRLVGLHQIVRGLDRRTEEASPADVAYLDLAMGRLGSLVLHSQVCRFAEISSLLLSCELRNASSAADRTEG